MVMVTINSETFEIEIKEIFSFDVNALPILNKIKEELKWELDNNSVYEDDIEDVKECISYELTSNDKIRILECIKNEYEFRIYRSDCEISMFDPEIIEYGVSNWIEEQFGFTPNEI
jgi:hypothetical protein